MNISLTSELEKIVKEKVESGLYNNASEVIREALRFMKTNEQLIESIKLDRLKTKLAEAEQDFQENRYTELNNADIASFFSALKKSHT